MKSVGQLVAEANQRVRTVQAADLVSMVDNTEMAFVDLRDSAELERDGKISGAVHVNRSMLEFAIDPSSPYHNPVFSSGKTLNFYCASGAIGPGSGYSTTDGAEAACAAGRGLQGVDCSRRCGREEVVTPIAVPLPEEVGEGA